MNKEHIDGLYLKAFEVMKETFKTPTRLIEWFSDLSDAIHQHSQNFKYMGADADGDMDIHIDVVLAGRIGIAWIKNDVDAIRRNLSNFGGDFNKVFQSGLSALAWINAYYDDPDYNFLDVFMKLSALHPIFLEVDRAEKLYYDDLEKEDQTLKTPTSL